MLSKWQKAQGLNKASDQKSDYISQPTAVATLIERADRTVKTAA